MCLAAYPPKFKVGDEVRDIIAEKEAILAEQAILTIINVFEYGGETYTNFSGSSVGACKASAWVEHYVRVS